MPMKLRMVTEPVYGYTPGGYARDGMLGTMLAIERGDIKQLASGPNTFFVTVE
jgi:hypothetical protein